MSVFCVIVFVSNKFHDWVQSEKGEVNFREVWKMKAWEKELLSIGLVGRSHSSPSHFSIKRNELREHLNSLFSDALSE